jgi:hypothetical protein
VADKHHDSETAAQKMEEHKMAKTIAEEQASVLETSDTLFNKPYYKAAERYCSSSYIQHSASAQGLAEDQSNCVSALVRV